MLGKRALPWRHWIRTHINDAVCGPRTTSPNARSHGSAFLTAGAISLVHQNRATILSPPSSYINEARWPKQYHTFIDCYSTFTLWQSSPLRGISSSSWKTKPKLNLDMRQLKTIEEITEAVYINLDAISPRNKSSFWAQLSTLLHMRDGLRGIIIISMD